MPIPLARKAMVQPEIEPKSPALSINHAEGISPCVEIWSLGLLYLYFRSVISDKVTASTLPLLAAMNMQLLADGLYAVLTLRVCSKDL